MISIVVPCYNEEENIEGLVREFKKVKHKIGDFELILVNNGSNDKTLEKIKKVMLENNWIRETTIKVNQGYGYGILKGLECCRGEWLGWIHADLQIPPKSIVNLVNRMKKEEKAEEGYYKGRRRNRPLIDQIFTFGMSVFETFYLRTFLYDINAQPTLIHRNFYQTLKNPPYDFSLDLYVYFMAKKKKLSIIRVPVKQQKRQKGKSSWNTGMKSRIQFIQRTVKYSKQLKILLKEGTIK